MKKKKPNKPKIVREWVPTIAELIDRLSIHQLKEVFISEHKDKYRREMKAISNDLNRIIKEKDVKLSGEIIRSIIILAQINAHIWYNEAKARKGEDQDLGLLRLTHGLNGIRNLAGNYLLNLTNVDPDRRDYKVDCLAADLSEWEIMIDLGDLNEKK